MGAMDTQELARRHLLLDVLHRHQGGQGTQMTFDIDAEVLAHGLDADDVGSRDGDGAMVGTDIDGRELQALTYTLQRTAEVGEAEGLQQIIDSGDLETLDGILGIGGGEYDEGRAELGGVLGELTHEVHAVEVGHIDVAEEDIDGFGSQDILSLHSAAALGNELEVGDTLDIGYNLAQGQGFIING